MSNEQLIHIFDNSTCLTQKQMKNYVIGAMTNEEAHAVEVHLNSCPMCSDAIDGLFEQKESGVATLDTVNADFLKDHLHINPQIHPNAITAAQGAKTIDLQKKSNTRQLWRTASLAAGLLLLVSLLWYYRFANPEIDNKQLAQEITLPEQAEMDALPASPQQPIAMSTPVKQDTEISKLTEETKATQKTGVAIDAKEDIAGDVAMPSVSATAERKKAATREEPVVVDYKVPFVGEDERKVITSEEIEKMPTRSTNNAAPVAKSFGNSYNADVATVATGNAADKSKKEVDDQAYKLELAARLYASKNYKDALSIYTQQMNAANNKDAKHMAAIGVAKCDIALGNTAKAKSVLQGIINEGGPYKREAKKLLKELE